MWVSFMLALLIVRDSALWASMPTSLSWYIVILSRASFMVLIALWGGEEGGVDGQVTLKIFGCSSDHSELSDFSSPSRVLRMFRSSSLVSALRGILSCKLSAVILNAVHSLLLLSLRISTQARWS